ncbi:DUF2784 domain-containing protein [Actinoplanes sp. NPDC051859]|uniref:DUF2784 domain-containing protein n=1 Tax=Actinoplanes sp. NPDC051859 TaxID=3363909 RepID=UPI0037B2C9A3
MGYQLLIVLAVATHYAFIAFGVFGGFLAWRWPRLIWWQAADALWLFIIVVSNLYCPLTWIEDRSRERLGKPALDGGFLDNHVAGIFYPAGYERVAQIVVAVLVLTSWVGFALLQRRNRLRKLDTGGDAADQHLV